MSLTTDTNINRNNNTNTSGSKTNTNTSKSATSTEKEILGKMWSCFDQDSSSLSSIQISKGIQINYNSSIGFHVLSSVDFRVGQVAAVIPKETCLSVKTTAIADVLDQEELGGILGLGIAVLYERSLQNQSPWFDYFTALGSFEAVDAPLFWNEMQLRWLVNTDLGRSIAQDKEFLISDYECHVMPLMTKYPTLFPPEKIQESFSLEMWLKTCTFVSSRAFEVDEWHGEAIVPFADLFNHKTNGEHVHFEGAANVCPFCGVSSGCGCQESDSSVKSNDDDEWQSIDGDDECNQEEEVDDDEIPTAVPLSQTLSHRMTLSSPSLPSIVEEEDQAAAAEMMNQDDDVDNDCLEMKFIKDCPAGSQIFNTYGTHCSTTLCRMYGFIDYVETGNPYSTVRIDRSDVAECLGSFGVEEVRSLFWDQVGSQVADQIAQAQQQEEEEGEGCGEGCGHDHGDHGVEEDMDVVGECGDDCSHDHSHDNQDQDEEEEEDEEIFDDFCLESNSTPSFHLYAYLHILLMPSHVFESVSSDLDAFIDFLVSLKTELEGNGWIPTPTPTLISAGKTGKGKGKSAMTSTDKDNDESLALTQSVVRVLGECVGKRLQGYPSLPEISLVTASRDAERFKMAQWIRAEEEGILKEFLVKIGQAADIAAAREE